MMLDFAEGLTSTIAFVFLVIVGAIIIAGVFVDTFLSVEESLSFIAGFLAIQAGFLFRRR
jgi:hypothetical protein